MKQIPHGYKLCSDGLYRKLVEFSDGVAFHKATMVRSRDGARLYRESGWNKELVKQ